MRRIGLSLIAFLALAGVIGAIATNGLLGGSDADRGTGGGSVAPAGTTGSVRGEESPTESSDGVLTVQGTGSSELPGLPTIGPSVIRTAHLGIRVEEDGFGSAFDEASLVAGRYGGYVESSSMAGTERRSGDLLLRVPADRFDDAMSDLRKLGTVERQQLQGRDVTSEFIDLEARLRTWQAQESVLLDLMADATTVEETLRIQRELQDVQFRIEQIKGQLRVLEDQTAFATIALSLREAGAVVTKAEDPGTRPSLAEAWRKAVDGFLGVCYSVVVGLGYLVPLALLVLLGWTGYRRVSKPRAATP